MKVDVSKLKEDFRRCHNQLQVVEEKKPKSQFSRGYDKPKPKKSATFEEKYANLEETVDSFTTSDLMYFFREKAKEAGVKYVIPNIKRDMGVFKKLKANYSNREICLMIEFIFHSPQDYLDKAITQPTVLISAWCNTIYKDSIDWANDRYIPYKKHKSVREWTDDKKETKVGDWG